MDQLVGFLLHPPLSEIGKKIAKMLKFTPHFQSAFGTAVYTGVQCGLCPPDKGTSFYTKGR